MAPSVDERRPVNLLMLAIMAPAANVHAIQVVEEDPAVRVGVGSSRWGVLPGGPVVSIMGPLT